MKFIMDWKPVDTAPFDRDVELAVIDGDGEHALVFPCRRIVGGWVNAETKKQLYGILPYTLAALGCLAGRRTRPVWATGVLCILH
jgi:hypothetical protein